jgi:hypothetical protein
MMRRFVSSTVALLGTLPVLAQTSGQQPHADAGQDSNQLGKLCTGSRN